MELSKAVGQSKRQCDLYCLQQPQQTENIYPLQLPWGGGGGGGGSRAVLFSPSFHLAS